MLPFFVNSYVFIDYKTIPIPIMEFNLKIFGNLTLNFIDKGCYKFLVFNTKPNKPYKFIAWLLYIKIKKQANFVVMIINRIIYENSLNSGPLT